MDRDAGQAARSTYDHTLGAVEVAAETVLVLLAVMPGVSFWITLVPELSQSFPGRYCQSCQPHFLIHYFHLALIYNELKQLRVAKLRLAVVLTQEISLRHTIG